MKKAAFILITIAIILGSCKNNNKNNSNTDIENKEPDKIAIDENNVEYKIDSTSDSVAVLLFSPDGNREYVIGNPYKIFQKTKSGLEFRYITSNNNKHPKVGDILHIDMEYRTDSDSLVFSSKSVDSDFKMRLIPPSHEGGCIEEAFFMMSEGDSAIFKIDAINFLTKTQNKVTIPDYLKKGDKFTFYIKMNKIVDGSNFVKNNSEIYKFYIDQERSLIERLAIELDFSRIITKSGLNIFTVSNGSGKKVKSGDLVTINYTASFIDGTVFDSTIERNRPFRFAIGNEEVIEGLEEGVSSMRVGDHSIFVIPFSLAYGDSKHSVIPPFSTLVFEVELLNVE